VAQRGIQFDCPLAIAASFVDDVRELLVPQKFSVVCAWEDRRHPPAKVLVIWVILGVGRINNINVTVSPDANGRLK
jgi:hypothetical protein